VIPVCAPTLAAGFARPADLAAASLLRTAMPSGPVGAEPIDWLAWFRKTDVSDAVGRKAVARGVLFGTTQLAIEAALSGRGVTLAPEILVREDIARGRLARPFAISLPDPFSFWLIYRRDRAREARIRAFATWIRDAAAEMSD